MAEALINPHILMWARERAGFGVAEIAEKLKIKPEQWLAWEHGEKKPSFSKAQEFAQKTHIPFGYLYLNEPPKQEPLLPDLRTIGDKPIGEFPQRQNVIARCPVLNWRTPQQTKRICTQGAWILIYLLDANSFIQARRHSVKDLIEHYSNCRKVHLANYNMQLAHLIKVTTLTGHTP